MKENNNLSENNFKLLEELEIVNNPYVSPTIAAMNLCKVMMINSNWAKKAGTDFGALLQANSDARGELLMEYVTQCIKAGESEHQIKVRFMNMVADLMEGDGDDFKWDVLNSLYSRLDSNDSTVFNFLLSLHDLARVFLQLSYLHKNPESVDEYIESAKRIFDL